MTVWLWVRDDQCWEMPSWIACLSRGGDGVLLTLRTGLYYYFDPDRAALRFLAGAPYQPGRFMFNDGGCGPDGRYFAGSMYTPLQPPAVGTARETPLWRYDGDGRWSEAAAAAQTSNGLAWSPDGRVMYRSHTEHRCILAYDYDVASGEVSRRRLFAEVDVPIGGPDGAADSDGFYWCAVFAQGCLLRFDPEGRLERRIDLPTLYPTKPAFGGDGLDTIYVSPV